MAVTVYGDISPRTAAHAVVKMLVRAQPHLVIEQFGQTYVMPNNATKVAKFRRYDALALATTPLAEGVTPAGKSLTVTDVTATLAQYGDFVTISDVIQDTHEDPVLNEATGVIGEQAAQTIETVRYGVLKAGTNVFYANGSAPTDVNTPVSLTLQRKVTRGLKRQNARMVTEKVSASPNFATEAVEASYIGLCHVDVENDIRGISGFINAKDYGSTKPMAHEIGAVEDVRYIRSTIFSAWPDAGGDKGSMVSTTGVKADVYPIIYIGRDAYGIVPLKGKSALTPIVKNIGSAGTEDPLNQRGTVGWKSMQTAVILNQLFMAVAKVAATEL